MKRKLDDATPEHSLKKLNLETEECSLKEDTDPSHLATNHYSIIKACFDNDADTVELILRKGQVNLQELTYCIFLAMKNNYTHILKLFIHDEKFDVNLIIANCCHVPRLKIYYHELKSILVTHPKFDLVKILNKLQEDDPLNIEGYLINFYEDKYLSLSTIIEKNLLQLQSLKLHYLLLQCYDQQLLKIENEPLVTLIINDERMDFNCLFELFKAETPITNEQLFIKLYKNKMLSLNCVIDKKILSESSLDLISLVIGFLYKTSVLREDIEFRKHLLTHPRLHANEKLNIYTLFKDFNQQKKENSENLLYSSEYNDISPERLFVILYQFNMFSLNRIKEEKILLESSLDPVELVLEFFDITPHTLIKDCELREHLLTHPKLYVYEKQWNIYSIFSHLYQKTKENSQDKLYSFEQLQLLVPYIHKAFQQNKEILDDYLDWIDWEKDSISKRQLIDVLTRPIYEKTRFFPQAASNSKLHLPEIWNMIANDMMHLTLGTVPEDHDLNNQPKLQFKGQYHQLGPWPKNLINY